MFFGKRLSNEKEEEQLVSTEIYSCSDDSCIGWMRKNFVSDDLLCPMCGSSMDAGQRDLPKM
ncbi:cold-inducible protein YdjO-related protein [Neobacillus sp. YIM B06451]|uniref:cold-inducible protein YdjO-related protein n=1 Tax=Neobacillus sp. YIM B06451 TaxID=3070994 RepID=UPI00292D9137|nr:cold-inducible protein YdjO-related protein [Neobacillus sp. YIM B06451]